MEEPIKDPESWSHDLKEIKAFLWGAWYIAIAIAIVGVIVAGIAIGGIIAGD